MYICVTKPKGMYNQTKRIVVSKSNIISIKGEKTSIPVGKIIGNIGDMLFVKVLTPNNLYQSHMDSTNSKDYTFNNKKQLVNTITKLFQL